MPIHQHSSKILASLMIRTVARLLRTIDRERMLIAARKVREFRDGCFVWWLGKRTALNMNRVNLEIGTQPA